MQHATTQIQVSGDKQRHMLNLTSGMELIPTMHRRIWLEVGEEKAVLTPIQRCSLQ